MPIRVQVPGHGIVEFPDGTSQDVMKAALLKLNAPPQAPAPSALDMLSGRKGFTSDDAPKEPDTWGGGFIKGLKREFDATSAPGAQGMAHPQTVGDFTSLLLPNMASSGAASGVESPAAEFLGRSKAALKAAAADKVPNRGMVGRTVSFPLRAYQKFEDALPSSNAEAISKFKGTSGAQPTPLTPQSPISPISPDVVDRNLRPPPAQVGRVVGKTPTVEEAIQSELEGMLGKGEPTQTTTTPPPQETAGAGPLKQSGKFKKSESLGQPGGYTSGNPGLKLEDFKFGTPASPQAEKAVQTAREQLAAERTPPVEAGVQGPDVGGLGTEVAPPSDAAAASTLDAGKPRLTANEAAANRDMGGSLLPNQDTIQKAVELRRLKGSRDAGSSLFGGTNLSPAERKALILKMAPGPSQLPLEAEQRINEAIHKAMMESLGKTES